MKLEVMMLDTWGNPNDGFHVNDSFSTHDTFTVPDDASDETILQKLSRTFPEYGCCLDDMSEILWDGEGSINSPSIGTIENASGEPVLQLRQIV